MNKLILSSAIASVLTGMSMTSVAQPLDCDSPQGCDERMVVKGELMRQPLTVVTDPKKPRLPLPSYDGAGFLKTIPGFSINRKGGGGGDPSLRGLGGSRINIVDDGQQTYGACGGRMDPPTAYIYPESYDSIEVIKGPQSVRHGPVGSAGTVLFNKDRHSFIEPTTTGRGSVTAGSFDRLDYIVELRGGDEHYYVDLDANQSSSDHYKDGQGNLVQSSYDRRNMDLALGWTPSDDSVVELSYGKSDGEAEYADRSYKARAIENENFTLLIEHEFAGEYLQSLEFQAYSNDNDHIMDDFDKNLTNNSGAHVNRSTAGAHLWGEFAVGDLTVMTGMDMQDSTHQVFKVAPSLDGSLDDLLAGKLKDDLSYLQFGVFAEFEYRIDGITLVSGLRYDRWQTDLLMPQSQQRDDDLYSGFGRIEHAIGHHQYYMGLGHAERMPDYWELSKSQIDIPTAKTFDISPEKTTQLDFGWIYNPGDLTFSSAFYYGEIHDYILIQAFKTANGDKSQTARNIDATIWGGELGMAWQISEGLDTQISLVYAHGDNDTDALPLAQVSPLEGRVTIDYSLGDWRFGLLWRLVDNQDRVAAGQGNISGLDLGESAGFGTIALNAAWHSGDHVRLSLGVENLFDREYAEHISKSGAINDVGLPMLRVNEPGRNAWLKLEYLF
ncbi:TonB-dependent copper receptor [Shewanella sp. NIFS-20-20]|uniref:TonB-dependent copper receptor n=1 Tax=Shewanella sp. NIFS-20-20 TaxID=2853806 RepID=UPI00352760FB